MGGRGRTEVLHPSPKCGADFGTHISRQSDFYRRLTSRANKAGVKTGPVAAYRLD